MKLSRIALAVPLVLLFASCLSLLCQESGLPVDVLNDLNSENVEVSIDALKRLENNPAVLQRPGVRKALVDLLDEANRVTTSALQDPNSHSGVGEGLAEYAGWLSDTVTKIVDWRDPHQACVLAQSAYSPGSTFSVTLATKSGAVLVPCLLKISNGIMYGLRLKGDARIIIREQVIPLMVELEALANDLSASEKGEIREAILGGLRDRGTRFVIVKELGRFGTPEYVPILQEIARSDPHSRPINEGKGIRYDNREAAAEAIQSIQERTKNR